jgi:hypothetical protein
MKHVVVAALGIMLTASPASCDVNSSPSQPTQRAGDSFSLRIEPENKNPYNRKAWSHDQWKQQGKGCDTRELVLSKAGKQVKTGADCKVLAGSWTLLYSGATVTDPSKLDIDHIVPVDEANNSRNWTQADRDSFYNDLDNLIPASQKDNRSKGGKDFHEWRPSQGLCTYATRYYEVKIKWNMSVDNAEAADLKKVLKGC